MTLLKINRLLPIYISIVPMKFEVDIQISDGQGESSIPPPLTLGGGIIISGRGQDTSAWHISDLSFHMLSLECPEIPISSFGNWASTSQNWIISGGGQDTSACYIWGHSSCGVTLMRRLSRVWVRGGWPAHAQCAYVEPRDIQPRGALSCSDCQGRQAWFCRSADL